MKIKKLLVILLTLVMIIGVFSGCKSANNDDKTLQQADKTTQNNEDSGIKGKVNKHGWLVPEETLEFSVAYGQDTPDEFDEYTKMLREYLLNEFNVKIEPHVWETDYNERQSLMLATGDYPDVITKLSIDQAQNWIDAGVAIDMLPIINEKVPDIKSEMGKYFERFVTEDGELYTLPNMWGYWDAPQVCPTIRLDWYKEIGEPEFTTPEEYYEVLKAMVEAHPTGTDGKKTYAIGMYNSTEAFINYYLGAYGLYQGWKIDANDNLTHWTQTQEGLDLALWLNQIQIDGYFDPDSFTQSFDEQKAKFANERYAGFLGSWWIPWHMGHEQWQDLRDDWDQEQRMVHVNVVAEGVDNATYSPINTMGYYRTLITDKAKDKAADILKWFAYEMTEDGMRIMGWGVPNTEYSGWTIDEQGSVEMDEELIKARIKNDGYNFTAQEKCGTMFLNTAIRLMYDDQSLSAYWDVNFRDRDPWFDLMYKNMEGTSYDAAYIQSIKIDPDDILATIKTQIKDLSTSGFAEAVMAPTQEQCKEKFLEMQKSVQKAGVEQLEEYFTEKYKDNVTNWN